MSMPMPIDHKSVLIDKLGEDPKEFRVANTYLPKKGPMAVHEISRLEADLLDFAKDPTLKDKDIKQFRPQPPKQDENMTDEEYVESLSDYRKAMQEYNTAVSAMKMQVPIGDKFAIEQYMEPFWKAIRATSAVKGRMFHALTKQVEEPQAGGLFGLGKKGPPQ